MTNKFEPSQILLTKSSKLNLIRNCLLDNLGVAKNKLINMIVDKDKFIPAVYENEIYLELNNEFINMCMNTLIATEPRQLTVLLAYTFEIKRISKRKVILIEPHAIVTSPTSNYAVRVPDKYTKHVSLYYDALDVDIQNTARYEVFLEEGKFKHFPDETETELTYPVTSPLSPELQQWLADSYYNILYLQNQNLIHP